MVVVTRVRFEHHEGTILGLGQSRPRLSWSFEGEDQDWFQKSYEIGLSQHDKDLQKFKINSFDSLLVPWPGEDLQSGQLVEVRVRVCGQDNVWTEWSHPTFAETGLLRQEDWKCSLIEASTPAGDGPHRPVEFRRKFSVSPSVIRARLYITSHGIYTATLNGVRVGDHCLAPGWTSYHHRLAYQTFEVTDLLSVGQNMLQVNVAEGWYCGKLGWSGGRYNVYGDQIGLIAMLQYDLDDGSRQSIGTGEDWQWAHGPWITAGLYDGVEYDSAQAIAAETQWLTVECKPVTDNLISFPGPPIRRTQELQPVEILTSPSRKQILDMGQNIVGWIKVKLPSTSSLQIQKGHKINFRYAEVLEHGEICTRPLRTAKAADKLILDPNSNSLEWEPEFTFHGFRYVEVDNWPTSSLKSSDITGIVIHTDMTPAGTFCSSNKLLNKLHENIIWSTRGNFVGLPTDCPQRDERLGWTGDINVFAPTANYLFDTAGLLTSWLKDLRLEQEATNAGIVPLVVPNIYPDFVKDAHAIWGDVAIMLPWELYRAYGDVEVLRRQYGSMKAWLNAIPRRENGLWNYTAEWKLADWLDPAAPPEDPGLATTEPEMVSDAFLVHITSLMAQISNIVGDESGCKNNTAQAERLRPAYANEYITPSGLLAQSTQTALSLSLALNLIPTTTQRHRATQHLVQLIRRNARFKLATGFAGTPYLGHALTSAAQSNIFYRMLLSTSCPSWLYPVTMGATTVWERWDSLLQDGSVNPGQMTSFNHYALGSVAGWMHSHILGLQIREPGWREFAVKPVPGGNLKWAQGEHVSPYGKIGVRWRIKEPGTKFWLEVRVPPNTKTHVYLPGQEEAIAVVSSGVHTWETDIALDPWPPEPIISAMPKIEIKKGELEYFDEVLLCPWEQK